MPFYPFVCPKCGHVEDFQLPMSEYNREIACPASQCDGMMKRLPAGGITAYVH